MLLFGHKLIKSESFYHITEIAAISATPPSSTLFVEFDASNLDIIDHLRDNAITFCLGVQNIQELIFASALEANFIKVPSELAKTAQSIAENYLFDAKILVAVADDDAINEMALLGIDGLLFPNAIIKIES